MPMQPATPTDSAGSQSSSETLHMSGAQSPLLEPNLHTPQSSSPMLRPNLQALQSPSSMLQSMMEMPAAMQAKHEGNMK